jgi:hypothetical protein
MSEEGAPPLASAALPGGGDAEVLRWDGATLVFRSPRAFAPGAPLRLTVRLPDGPCTIELKSGGSRRLCGESSGGSAPVYEVRARAINLRRDVRDRFAVLLVR